MIRTEGPRTGHLRHVGVIVRVNLAELDRFDHGQQCGGTDPIHGCGALGVGLAPQTCATRSWEIFSRPVPTCPL